MNTPYRACPTLRADTLLTSSSNDALVSEYLSWKQSYTATAFRAYKLWIRRFQAFVNKMPESLTYKDYVAFANSLERRYASANITFALTIVRNYLRFFLEQGRLGFPLYLVRVPRAFLNSHQAVTEEEYRKIVAHLSETKAQRLRDLSLIMLLHDTGLRIGELLSLEIGDIGEDCSAVVRTEKTIRERRVFWNGDTDNVLQRYLVERVNHGPSDCDALFAASDPNASRALSVRAVQHMLKRVLSAAGISRRLSPHSFRHAFVHRLAKLGVPDAIIAQLVGHSTPNSIANYTKLSRPEFREYANRQLEASAQLP